MKKILLAVLALVVLLVGSVVTLGVVSFGGLAPLRDEPLEGLGEVVKDGHVGVGILDVGNGKVALIDAGNDATGKALQGALARRGRTQADVVAIFITHGHPDHIATVPLFPSAQVYARSAELPFLTAQTPYRGPLPRLLGVTDPGFRPTPIEDGVQIPVGDRIVEAFAVPGHTAGSTAYLVEGVLFLGDNAVLDSSGGMKNAPWIVSDDVDENADSLRALAHRLSDRPIRRIVFSHSGSGPGAVLQAF